MQYQDAKNASKDTERERESAMQIRRLNQNKTVKICIMVAGRTRFDHNIEKRDKNLASAAVRIFTLWPNI